MPPDEDAARLWDMLTYAREVIDSLAGLTFDQYMADKTLRLATERRIEIIGEAARNVSDAFQNAHPESPGRRSSPNVTSSPTSTATSARTSSSGS